MVDNIAHANMLFYPLYYDIISLKGLNIAQAFHLLLDFAENSIVSWYFKIQSSVRITEGSDDGDSDNRGSTVQTLTIEIISNCSMLLLIYNYYNAFFYRENNNTIL